MTVTRRGGFRPTAKPSSRKAATNPRQDREPLLERHGDPCVGGRHGAVTHVGSNRVLPIRDVSVIRQ
ncbi:hypothetical protein DB31_6672 [Hyalangium minutum]|uniref:Uncharacterized protein n=1 Tax=Hyalangium minutum TaxID=394096 RepID=A0A085WPT4_9BACT|nr:hypothetical protein DB31_6672 [Hyalangium minutum]